MGKATGVIGRPELLDVSIQLVFPASGKVTTAIRSSLTRKGFHSISFPSEWEAVSLAGFSSPVFGFPFN